MNDAESLKQWAVNELKVTGLSNDCDMSYICRGELNNLWKYLQTNVTNGDTARMIHGNIRIHKLTSPSAEWSDSNGSALDEKMKRYKQLIKQTNQQQSEIAELEKTIKFQQTKLSTKSSSAARKTQTSRETRIKSCLLSQHQDVTSQHLRKMSEFERSLQAFADKRDLEKQSERAAEYLVCSEGGGSNALLAEYRALHTSTCHFLSQLLRGALNKRQLQTEKTGVKASLSRLMSASGPATLIKFIIHDIHKSGSSALEEAELVNYERDTETLRFKVASEGLMDVSSEPPLNDGVNQLIERRQLEHQETFLKTEQLKNHAVLLNKRLSDLRAGVNSRISASLPQHDPRLRLIREVMDEEVVVRQTHAALTLVNSIKDELQQQVESCSENVSSLKEKQRRICSFKADVNAKQSHICVLMKQNVSSAERLGGRQSMLVSTLQSLSRNVEPLSSLSSAVLRENQAVEMRRFSALPLQSLSTNPHSTILGLRNSTGKSDQEVERICHLLGFDRSEANDVVVKKLLARQWEVVDSYMRVPAVGDNADSLKLIDEINNSLIPRAREQTEKTIRELKPKLEAGSEMAGRSLAKCDDVDILIEGWWHQPGLKIHLHPNNT